jgi:Leucine-rich repeat (LRR) protein
MFRNLLFSSLVLSMSLKTLAATSQKSLETEYSKIESLPASLAKLDDLKKITVKASCIESEVIKKIPVWFGNFELLTELNLGTEIETADRQDCNLVVALPDDLSKLKSLKKFIVDDAFGKTGYLALEKIKMPIGLEVLSLNRIGLNDIPSWVFMQKNLKRLTIQYGDLKEIPRKIYSLKELESIDLLSNNIQVLPVELASLPKLKTLILGNNKITKLQQAAIKKLLPKVEVNFTNEWDDSRANQE